MRSVGRAKAPEPEQVWVCDVCGSHTELCETRDVEGMTLVLCVEPGPCLKRVKKGMTAP